jgi:hypothetical protein
MADARAPLEKHFEEARMKRRTTLVLVCMFALAAVALSAADLTIDMQVNTAAKDYSGNYLTFKGAIASVEKDQFAPGADATSGASRLASTEVFNAYRFDVKGKQTMPSGLRFVLLYAVANDAIRTGDNLTVSRSGGTVVVHFVHRGTAFEITTDAAGKIALPSATAVRKRTIGHTDNTISPDFSSNGRPAGVDWKKVWDTSILDGKQVGSTPAKTGKVVADIADSDIFIWQGDFQLSLEGKTFKIGAALDAVKK